VVKMWYELNVKAEEDRFDPSNMTTTQQYSWFVSYLTPQEQDLPESGLRREDLIIWTDDNEKIMKKTIKNPRSKWAVIMKDYLLMKNPGIKTSTPGFYKAVTDLHSSLAEKGESLMIPPVSPEYFEANPLGDEAYRYYLKTTGYMTEQGNENCVVYPEVNTLEIPELVKSKRAFDRRVEEFKDKVRSIETRRGQRKNGMLIPPSLDLKGWIMESINSKYQGHSFQNADRDKDINDRIVELFGGGQSSAAMDLVDPLLIPHFEKKDFSREYGFKAYRDYVENYNMHYLAEVSRLKEPIITQDIEKKYRNPEEGVKVNEDGTGARKKYPVDSIKKKSSLHDAFLSLRKISSE